MSFTASVILVFLLAAQHSTADSPGRCSAYNQKCSLPSASALKQTQRDIKLALATVNRDLAVGSYYKRDVQDCLGSSCKVSSDLQKRRDKLMRFATAFHNAMDEGADLYLDTIASGCPNAQILAGWIQVASKWASNGGFLGQLSEQGEVEVDWKLNAIASSYIKMKPYIPATTQRLLQSWISKLYAQALLRTNRYDNNHWMWHLSGLVWANVALGNGDKVQQHTQEVLLHMDQKVNDKGVVVCEDRCTLTPKYHLFYMHAALGGLAGYKAFFGSIPDQWADVAARAKRVMNNVNTGSAGARVMSASLGYDGTTCRASQMKPVDKSELATVNSLFVHIVNGQTSPGPCFSSPYFGKLRNVPYLHEGFENPPLASICCRGA